ncbi:MAG TPA: response regulator [Ktedonobacterales bacterium]|jgi:two-component system OmpR family response regulator
MSKYPLSPIVVIDPDPLYQRQIAYLLQESFQCIPAATLSAAFQMILRYQPGLIILELDQPDGDAFSFIHYLQRDSALKAILIACVTTRASVADKVRAFRVGADDYIVKPVSTTLFHGQMLLLRRTGYIARNVSVR